MLNVLKIRIRITNPKKEETQAMPKGGLSFFLFGGWGVGGILPRNGTGTKNFIHQYARRATDSRS